MADHLQEDWRARAEAARGVAELMQDPIGKQAMLDVADACEQLANSPMLAKVTRKTEQFPNKIPEGKRAKNGCNGEQDTVFAGLQDGTEVHPKSQKHNGRLQQQASWFPRKLRKRTADRKSKNEAES